MSARQLALCCLLLATAADADVDKIHYGLELASADVSWRVCRAGFEDPMFPGVCPSSSDHNPLHVAVTVSATWWAAPSSLGPEGPGKWTADADPAQQHVVLPAETGALARSIGWKPVAGAGAMTTLVAPNAAAAGYSTEGYAFAVTHAEQLSTKTNTSLHHVATRFSFMVALPHAGEFEVEFTGCCRWAELGNIQHENYPHHVPWKISARIAASTDSALASSFSPRLSMPITQVVMWDVARRAFRVHADNGGALISLIDDEDMAGRYLETAEKMSLDSSVYVITNTMYAAYVREDGQKSIVWFASPEMGTNQFSASGAWTYGPGWVVIRGDVRMLVGTKPLALPHRPVLEGLGGGWPNLPMYNELRYTGPSYQGGVVQMAAKKTNALVEYEHVVKLQKLMPYDSLLLSEISHGTPSFELGTVSSPAFMPAGTMIDSHEGVLVLSPASYKDLCLEVRGRAPELQFCAIALPVRVTVTAADGHTISASLDFWVQVLEPKKMEDLYSDISNLKTMPEYMAYPPNPLPRLVFPNDTTLGNEGMALYTSATKSLHVQCGTTRVITMPVEGLPTLAALSVNRLKSTDWTKAVPLAESQIDSKAKNPVRLLDPVPSAWHASDAWDHEQVHVSGADVKLTLAPTCGRKGSRGLQMVCIQVTYALDDEDIGDVPSNYGCHLENPNTAGRCYATSAPSRCLYYTVTNQNDTAMPRHTAPPMPTPTPPPPMPTPAPTQPVIEAVAEPPAAVARANITHVLDLVAHLPDPHAQIKSGELSMYFVEDLAMLPLGQAPVDTLRTSFDAQVTGCLCAGSRDLTLQRSLLDTWNKQKNSLDSASRSVWYRMGEELKGVTVSLDNVNYKWTCIAEVKLDVKKALTREIVSGDATKGCVMCWHAHQRTAQKTC